jgi:hypothetical protein
MTTSSSTSSLGGEHQPADSLPPAQGHRQHHSDRPERDHHRDHLGQHATGGQQAGQDRQVGRHGQVLDHQDRQHDRGLAVAEPAQLTEQLGSDSRRRHVGDPAEHHRRQQRPTKQQPRDQARGEVERQVDHASASGAAASPAQRPSLEPAVQKTRNSGTLTADAVIMRSRGHVPKRVHR